MDETILLPSPNWFQVSNLAVSPDGWLIYGGPSKSLCVLEPRTADNGVISGNDKYQAHVVVRAHLEKIVSVDISPEWLLKRSFLTGSSDGSVKQWVLETVNSKIKIKATHSHDVHQHEREEIVGVGYCTETTAITLGCFSNIVKWDLVSNVAKTYPNFMKNFKPTCMTCSRHGLAATVAVGTKQGVVFLLDLSGNGKTLYKVRGQDDEVMNVSWCPQYEVFVKKTLRESKARSHLATRLEAIRNEGVKETNVLEQSGTGKNLPEDSFDESVVQEDDMFDIYKDHEPNEFGHKKYEPEDILVKVKQEEAGETDYLAECLKLKEDILKRKNQTDPSIESLVEALDKTHVEGATQSETDQTKAESAQTQTAHAKVEITESETSTSTAKCDNTDERIVGEATPHIHKHLLASVGKYGGVRIWSKSGKLVGSCAIPVNVKNTAKKVANCPTVLWHKPDSLLIVDGKSQLLECNPLRIDCKNKLEWQIVHTLHKRGMYCIATNAPRIQKPDMEPSDDWSVWSVSQDRNIIRYCLKSRKALKVHATCGGFLYTVQPCPYDAGKVAVSVGDGAVRVWESSTPVDDDTKLSPGHVTTYWQNVQGKVLTVAWHPTRENLLAFATAEARVGLIDTSGKTERPARVLQSALTNGVYAVCWGEGMRLYASGGGSLVMYRADQPDQAPETIRLELEGQEWQICAVNSTPRGLLVGSFAGAVAVLTSRPPHTFIAATFLFNKMIHSIEWHPQQTSSSSEESQYKDLIAVSSLDKGSSVIILEFGTKEEDGTKQLTTWKTLTGHKMPVLQVAWNPHRDEHLLSTSQDSTVRIWDIITGSCISIFGGHTQSSMGAAWVAQPQLPHYVMSGGGDACLRLWNIYEHKAEDYDETKHEIVSKKQVKTDKKEKKAKEELESGSVVKMLVEGQAQVATSCEITSNKSAKAPRRFMLPTFYKQLNDRNKLGAPRKMLLTYLKKNVGNLQADVIDIITMVEKGKTDVVANEKGDGKENTNTEVEEKGNINMLPEGEGNTDTLPEGEGNTDTAVNEKVDDNRSDVKQDLDFLKIFGSIKEVNEFLDLEMENHLVAHHPESWIMLSIFRGHIDTMIQFASQRDMLCHFLISMAPCVSFKYWKDATQLYLAQIDRLVAKGEEEKLYENRSYGGPIYRKAAILLSMHDVMGAVAALVEGKLFKEAYVLCRLRYMDSVANETLKKWAHDLACSGQLALAAMCYIVLENLTQAAEVLSRSQDQEFLRLSSDIAKVAGMPIFADHMDQKAQRNIKKGSEITEELLKQLPSKIELLMKDPDKGQTSDNLKSDTLNGDKLYVESETKE